ncbi:hypothetical protein OJ997_22945 [Solirubrobacter phytolaccae]|uniref:Uncharacterized protein n=1 Tax=Solirubrobacter phytolaccae TaxID=1404360 RepID=A0A9X3SB32_9ACTN|nr:hypothetical protein [Solirubrobacter phytolaccae]MDA0183186.1 hypothetical protein [Solirubrobacter phytolaccae]
MTLLLGFQLSDIWVDLVVEILAEAGVIDRGRTGKDGKHGVAIDDLTRASRAQLPDRDAVAGHREALPPVERAHDLATLVPELALRDRSSHGPNVHSVRDSVYLRPMSSRMEQAEPDAEQIVALLDAIPEAHARTQEGIAQARRGEGIPLDRLA